VQVSIRTVWRRPNGVTTRHQAVLATIFFEIDVMTLSAIPLDLRVATPPHVNNFPCQGSFCTLAGDLRQLEKCPHKNRWQPKQNRHRGFPRDELAKTMTVDKRVCEYPFGYRSLSHIPLSRAHRIPGREKVRARRQRTARGAAIVRRAARSATRRDSVSIISERADGISGSKFRVGAMGDFASHLVTVVTALISGMVSAWLTYAFALRRFRAEK
jgi:hypothetical protein